MEIRVRLASGESSKAYDVDRTLGELETQPLMVRK